MYMEMGQSGSIGRFVECRWAITKTDSLWYHNIEQMHSYMDTRQKHKQEHPRGSIVEPQDLHQDGLNSPEPYNDLNTPIISAHVSRHVYDIF